MNRIVRTCTPGAWNPLNLLDNRFATNQLEETIDHTSDLKTIKEFVKKSVVIYECECQPIKCFNSYLSAIKFALSVEKAMMRVQGSKGWLTLEEFDEKLSCLLQTYYIFEVTWEA